MDGESGIGVVGWIGLASLDWTRVITSMYSVQGYGRDVLVGFVGLAGGFNLSEHLLLWRYFCSQDAKIVLPEPEPEPEPPVISMVAVLC